ncbi:uncharacterized protein LOC116029808 [Ipomoea triloba]|uniref:uncharacterized protein LOC116029808 n=1 Tax=Ipomoea triloba TaxID=35885 RepID=UPI00125E3CFB|nr:uncharacterized protein LOC116029808 [Ipomoea triloba]
MVYDNDVITSDHSAIYTKIEDLEVVRQGHKFMFENVWLKEAGCKEVVLGNWNMMIGDILPNRLSQCGMLLKRWGGDYAKRLEKEIVFLQARLNVLRDRNDSTALHMFQELDDRLSTLYDNLNIIWKQRAKQFWLAKGDRNTKIFHLQCFGKKMEKSHKQAL